MGGEEGVCTSTCNDWPYSQCRVELRRPDGSWQAATCLHPYTARPGPFNPFPAEVHKLSTVRTDSRRLQEMRRRMCLERGEDRTGRLLSSQNCLCFLSLSLLPTSAPVCDGISNLATRL